jgi:hypothetical protein
VVKIRDSFCSSRDAQFSAPVARRELCFDHRGGKSGVAGGCIDDAFGHQRALLVVTERPHVQDEASDQLALGPSDGKGEQSDARVAADFVVY